MDSLGPFPSSEGIPGDYPKGIQPVVPLASGDGGGRKSRARERPSQPHDPVPAVSGEDQQSPSGSFPVETLDPLVQALDRLRATHQVTEVDLEVVRLARARREYLAQAPMIDDVVPNGEGFASKPPVPADPTGG